MEFFFMFIGLGFFLLVIWKVEAAEERHYQRKLNEAREFGFQRSTLKKEAERPPKK